ncbi:hypothetical protein [Nocardia alba]|uniref:Uncharacterized protein n=1 Tax=Nocardia alba TaxID=225051 RepID=A0A4R1FZJ9_9NOCA|nr:hypothetical protein [Nocardia alba]TCK00708.1 hypothetical protein DFR71_1717 [Nocardia alba]
MSEQPLSVAEMVAAWPLPPGAHLADAVRRQLLATLEATAEQGDGELAPEALAPLALAPLLIVLGRLEVDLADARTRIDELERALLDRRPR